MACYSNVICRTCGQKYVHAYCSSNSNVPSLVSPRYLSSCFSPLPLSSVLSYSHVLFLISHTSQFSLLFSCPISSLSLSHFLVLLCLPFPLTAPASLTTAARSLSSHFISVTLFSFPFSHAFISLSAHVFFFSLPSPFLLSHKPFSLYCSHRNLGWSICMCCVLCEVALHVQGMGKVNSDTRCQEGTGKCLLMMLHQSDVVSWVLPVAQIATPNIWSG